MRRYFTFICLLFSSNLLGQTYFLKENFASASVNVPPSGWQNVVLSGDISNRWHFNNPADRLINYPLTDPFAILDGFTLSTSIEKQNVALESPAFDAQSTQYVLLIFDHVFSSAESAEGQIQVSVDGINWQVVKTFTESVLNPRTEVIDISSWAAHHNNVKLRFKWGGYNSGYWAIDNVKIYDPLRIDGGISAIDSPIMPFSEGNKEVKVTLTNYGYDNLTSVNIKWSVDGIMQNNYQFSGNISFSNSQPDIVLGSLNFKAGSKYSIKIWTEKPNNIADINESNDTIDRNIVPSLCGSYTIGGTDPDFNTLNYAGSVLTNAGVTCPVVFKIRSGNYPEKIELNPIPGSSEINTVTFESESGDSTSVIVTNPLSGSHTIIFNKAANIIFRHISVVMNGYNAGSFMIDNSSRNILIENCDISNSWYANPVTVRGGSKKITIRNSYIHNGYGNNGIAVIGSRDVLITGNKIQVDWESAIAAYSGIKNLVISNNDITGSGSPGINLNPGPDSVYVLNNRLKQSGIYITSSDDKVWSLVQGNRISTSVSSGIVLNTKNCLVANNYITLSGLNSLNGVQVTNSSNTGIVFNSINITNSNVTSKNIYVDGGSDINVRNNIFSNPGGGYSAYVANNPSSIIWDYNNYYNPYGRIGFLGDSTYRSLPSWVQAIAGEDHGISSNPFFTDDEKLIPHQVLLNNNGVPVSEVKYDIDSVARNISAPDIGASEISPCSNDAGISAISFPSKLINAGFQNVRIVLQNQGTITLTSAIINWEINGISQNTVNWTGSLAANMNEEITIGSFSFQSGKIYYIRAWSKDPNNTTDCDKFNDTIVSPKIYARLCGTYTVGGTDSNFATINDAVYVLTNAGVTCPVILKVRNGTYRERVEINPIPGSSEINTVTIESQTGYSYQVMLWSADGRIPTLKINGAKNIIINKIGVKLHYFGEGAIAIGNNSENISIKGSQIVSDYATVGILVNSGTNKISITENSFIGYNGCLGVSLLNPKSVKISGNVFKDGGIAGNAIKAIIDNNYLDNSELSLSMNNDSLFITGNRFPHGSGISVSSGSSVSGYCLIEGNRIHTSNSTGISVSSNKYLVANNYVTVSGENTRNAVEVNNCINSKIVFNSINVLNNNINSSKCIMINGGSGLDIINNIFLNMGVGYCASMENPPSNLNWDYNDYYSPYGYIGFMNNKAFNSVSTWGNAVNGDANSIFSNPYFTNDTTPTPNQILIKHAAKLLPEINSDIDKNSRNPQTAKSGRSFYENSDPNNPDMGAKQFIICKNDAGINHITSPSIPITGGIQNFKTILQNQGTDNLTSVIVNWQVNNGIQQSFAWSGVLISAQNIELTLGTFEFIYGAEYKVKVWTSNPNGFEDCDHFNDTLNLYVAGNPLPDAAKNITGPTSVCQGQVDITYTVPPVTGAISYIWTLPDGTTGTSSTNSISVNYSNASASGNISVKGQNSIGTGVPSILHVIVNAKPDVPHVEQISDELISSSLAGNQWYESSIAVIGATSQYFKPSDFGEYYTVVTINGCSSEPSNTIPYIVSGIMEMQDGVIKLYPNPSFGLLTLECYLAKDNNVTKLTLYNSAGKPVKVILDGKNKFDLRMDFNLQELRPGIYFLEVKTQKKEYVLKFVKE